MTTRVSREKVLDANATLVSTVVEALASLAEASGAESGAAFLRRALYPLLEKVGPTWFLSLSHPSPRQKKLKKRRDQKNGEGGNNDFSHGRMMHSLLMAAICLDADSEQPQIFVMRWFEVSKARDFSSLKERRLAKTEKYHIFSSAIAEGDELLRQPPTNTNRGSIRKLTPVMCAPGRLRALDPDQPPQRCPCIETGT